MGWTYLPVSRKELIEHLIAPWNDAASCVETIAHDLQKDILWSVEQFTEMASGQSRRLIVCYLLKGAGGYKALDEAMHPYDYSCPLPFLDLAPERCPAWRDGVRQYHQRPPSVQGA